MSVSTFDELKAHIGHKCKVVTYVGENKEPVNVSIECLDCNEVLVSYDKDEEEE